MKSTNGQISVEFMTYIGLLALVAVMAYFIISSMKTSELSTKEFYLGKMIGQSFVESIGIGVEGGKGFNYTFDVPQMTGTVTTKYNFIINTKNNTDKVALIEWTSQSGQNSSYIYNLPDYKYDFSNASCFDGQGSTDYYRFKSNCTEQITLTNNGSTLFISTQ